MGPGIHDHICRPRKNPAGTTSGRSAGLELAYPSWLPQVTGPFLQVTGYLSW